MAVMTPNNHKRSIIHSWLRVGSGEANVNLERQTNRACDFSRVDDDDDESATSADSYSAISGLGMRARALIRSDRIGSDRIGTNVDPSPTSDKSAVGIREIGNKSRPEKSTTPPLKNGPIFQF